MPCFKQISSRKEDVEACFRVHLAQTMGKRGDSRLRVQAIVQLFLSRVNFEIAGGTRSNPLNEGERDWR